MKIVEQYRHRDDESVRLIVEGQSAFVVSHHKHNKILERTFGNINDALSHYDAIVGKYLRGE